MDGASYELTGGSLCLDFANTLEDRPTSPHERLASYADLLRWSVAAGAIDAEMASILGTIAIRDDRPSDVSHRAPDATAVDRIESTHQEVVSGGSADGSSPATVVARARLLREAIFQVVRAGIVDQVAPSTALATIAQEWSRAQAHVTLVEEGDLIVRRWSDDLPHLDRPLWPIADAFVAFIGGPARSRLRICESPTCDWVFLDTSRNRTRQWCDMKVCGNRAKARRFQARQRARSGPHQA